METYLYFFYSFSTLAISSAAMVVLSTHTIYAALFLIVTFFNAALVILLIGEDYLAIIFVLVYVGAIMILFLFAIMMLDIKDISTNYTNMYMYYSFTALLLLLLYMELVYVKALHITNISIHCIRPIYLWFALKNHCSSITKYTCLYTTYLMYMILAGLLLFIAMIGAIILTMSNDSVTTQTTKPTPVFIK